jgi:hypothetical protein
MRAPVSPPDSSQNDSVPADPNSTFEDQFFGNAINPDGIDPELARLAGGPSWVTPGLLVLVLVFTGYLAWSSFADLKYALSPSEPLELGRVEEWGTLTEMPQLLSHRYASLEGITHRRSVSGDRVFFKLIGDHVYVERYEIDDRPRLLRGTPRTPSVDTEVRQTHTEPGRLVAFEDLDARYEPFVQYYSNGYGVEFCGFTPNDNVRIQLNSERQRAELQLAEELGHRPSAAEFAEANGDEFECQHGWLLMSGQSPRSMRWLIGLYVVFTGIIAGCLWFLYRWYRANYVFDEA